MRYLELALEPVERPIHPLFEVMADSPFVTEARMLDWNAAPGDTTMAVFGVEGDPERFAAAVEDRDVVVDCDLTARDDRTFYATIHSETTDTERRLFLAFNQGESVLVPPLTYRDGRVVCRVVGSDEQLRTSLDAIPAGIAATVERVGQFEGRPPGVANAVTDRQREAVEAALSVGYYEVPRQATAEDVAARLDCTPSTASELLRRAEVRLVTAAFEG